MSLAVIGSGASYEFRWRRWALLQDTVAALLESGHSGKTYPQLEAIGRALAEDSMRIVARDLADEIGRIREGLKGHSPDELRVGARTAAVLYPVAHSGYRPLTSVELAQIAPFAGARDLAEYFSAMLESLLEVCAKPAADGTIEVLDG